MGQLNKTRLLAGAGVAALIVALVAACAHDKGPVAQAGMAPIPDRPDWNWDVRPILSQNCFGCHGSAAQKGGVRLDTEKAAYAEITEDKGHRSIVPGKPGKSELWRRVSTSDPAMRMPPLETHKTLSPRETAILERWIKQGAHYKQHWAYIPPAVAKTEQTKWDRQAVNDIDRYVYAKLAGQGLSPSPEADRETLINRVYLDLTGLPPSLKDVDDFVADKDPKAYEKVVDRLLASQAYAERQANVWLDVARYADTRGGLNDNDRPISFPYRDWVISAFQRNMPYDKFVTWQLAGDKLNGGKPTREQLLATAFLKSGRQDTEGGSIDEDFRMNYVEERTELMGRAFLGQTMSCAKCHDHKYDPIFKTDYYGIAGIFNQMDERGSASFARGTPMGSTLEWPTAKQAAALAAAHARTVAREKAYEDALRAVQAKAQAAADAVTPAQRASFVHASIDADTQAYYPLDKGYGGSFDELYLDPQATAPGAPVPGVKTKYEGMTSAQLTALLQKQILADVKAGKPAPSLSAPAAAMASAPSKPSLIKASLAKAKGMAKPAGGKIGPEGEVKGGTDKAAPLLRRRFGGMASDQAALRDDPGLPRVASHEVEWALEQLVASGFTDQRLGDPQRIMKRQLPQWVHGEALQWTDAGLPGEKRAWLSNAKFVPGHKGQGIQLHDTVFAMDKGVGMFERTQPYSIDFWLKLPAKPYFDSTRPRGPSASILYNNGGIEGLGYELSMSNNKLSYAITHNAPAEMLAVSTKQDMPTGRWVHVTSTYDGNSRAEGMHLYIDGKPAAVEIEHNHLTRTSFPRGGNSQFVSYFGLAAGVNFNRPELVDAALDDVRVVTRAITPLEVTYLQDPASVSAAAAPSARADLSLIVAGRDPAVQKAWADLTEARLAEQSVETPIYRVMVAGDQLRPRKSYVLDRGVYNSWLQEVKPGALSHVFAWNEKLPRDRLGLAAWLFDPKHPLTARVYVNRMWQGHFGTGIVQSVDDFGTQGANPTNPELLDYLAVEFQRSGWDMRHMHKLMVMSATYRQSSSVSRENLQKDPRDIYLERAPRFRMSAEVLRDNALAASGILVDRAGGDSVFPYAPDAIWDGVAQGAVVYPTNVPDDQHHRRSMYTYIKRNAPVANLAPFDMPDRNNSSVVRSLSNTPLQALVLLNDTQFVEAYRKLAERALKSSANPDEQLVTLFRLAVRRHPTEAELTRSQRYRQLETARMMRSPSEVKTLLAIGVAPADPTLDPVQVAALTLVTAGAMNSPDAYTLR